MANSKQRRQARRAADAASPARDGLQNLVAGLGTSRDKSAYSEYTTPNVLDMATLGNMYRSSWLAKKIVNIPAEDMTRAWREIMFDDETVGDPEDSSRDEVLEAERRFAIRHKVTQAIKWARLYGGSVMILGVGDPQKYAEPLDVAKIKRGDLRFIQVMDRHLCIPTGEFDYSDITSEDFGMPKYYTVAKAQGLRIHRSRVIRFIGTELPYWESLKQTRWGDSVLQSTYDTLRGKDTVTASIASMMFEANVDVVKVPDLGDMLATKEGEEKLVSRFQTAAMMKSFNRMLLLGDGEDYDKKSNAFSGLDAIMREFRVEVAGACDIPVSRLFGMSASGLNATGDNEVRNYYDMVRAQQETILRPALERLDEVLLRHIFGAMPEGYRFEFQTLWQVSDSEKATVEKTRADRDKVYFDMGVLTEGAIARELRQSGVYTTMTEDDVSLAEELAQMPEPEPPAIEEPGDAEADEGQRAPD